MIDAHSLTSAELTWTVINCTQLLNILFQLGPHSSPLTFSGIIPRSGMCLRWRTSLLAQGDPPQPLCTISVGSCEVEICVFIIFAVVMLIFLFCADMNQESPDYYMIGHCIDGRVLYPATGYLVLAWRTLMRSLGTVMEHSPVLFEDVTIHRATILPKTGKRFVWLLLLMQTSHYWKCMPYFLLWGRKIYFITKNTLLFKMLWSESFFYRK